MSVTSLSMDCSAGEFMVGVPWEWSYDKFLCVGVSNYAVWVLDKCSMLKF